MTDERDGRFGNPGTTQFGPHAIRWHESGPTDGPVILLLHGLYAGAHGYEWRDLAPLPAVTARVRVPDLLGAGSSDRPALVYAPQVVLDEIGAIVADAGNDVHVVASSLTAAYALRVAARGVPMASLTLITPTGMGARRETARDGGGHRLFDVVRATPLGDVFVWALTSGPSISWFQRNKTYRNPAALTAEEVAETRRAGRLPGAKHLQLAFVFDRLSIDITPDDVAAVEPAVVWGGGQGFVDHVECERWRQAGADVVELPSGLPQVEDPATVAAVIRRRVGGEPAAP